jgi:hypothetical protein
LVTRRSKQQVNRYQAVYRSSDRHLVSKPDTNEKCSPDQLCARCSMVKVIAHRFVVFRQAFGREPLPSEPLFFIPNRKRPITAPQEVLEAQLAEAAEETGVSVITLWDLLEIGKPIELDRPQLRAAK